jgi:hypothetical protein
LQKYSGTPDFDLQAHYVKQTAVQVFGGKQMLIQRLDLSDASKISSAVSETTAASLTTFILGILVRPDVQSRAQQEVDSVVGPDRLPECADIPEMPYFSAVIKEVLRLVVVIISYMLSLKCLNFDTLYPDGTHLHPREFRTPQVLKTSTTATTYRKIVLFFRAHSE